MDPEDYDMGEIDIAWCPGCGNFSILPTLKDTLAELEIRPQQLVIVSGIGQAAKTPHYLRTNLFNGLHGRSLPVATAIKACNPGLTVIAESGDGCMYGEGGNHLVHCIRRNPDITCVVHNNMVYGLTKGQASPTSQLGFETSIQVRGVFERPLDPVALGVSLDASFVARTFAGSRDHMREILKRAVEHKGFSLVDIFQPCVSFNKVNTFKWFREHTYEIEDSHDPEDREAAFAKAIETDKLALGVVYLSPRPTFEEESPAYAEGDDTPLFGRRVDRDRIQYMMDQLRGF
jgi:2-oxoglutarate ferredoxin oxidoreductase subunit beta